MPLCCVFVLCEAQTMLKSACWVFDSENIDQSLLLFSHSRFNDTMVHGLLTLKLLRLYWWAGDTADVRKWFVNSARGECTVLSAVRINL